MYGHSRVLVSVLAGLAFVSTTTPAGDTLDAGRDWLKWGNQTRLAYVSAYLHGQGRGFRDGCILAQGLYSAGEPSGLPGETCVARAPSYSRNLEDYVAKITEYYRSYPGDRNVPIFEVLEGLSDARARLSNRCTITFRAR